MVMTSGIQMRRPVMRYFFKVRGNKKARLGPGHDNHLPRLGCSLGLRLGLLLGLFLGLRFGFRFGLGFGLVLGFLFRRLGRLVLEIGGVPAAALQLKPRRTQQLAERRLMADRAFGKCWLTNFLKKFLLMTASVATVLVDRHGVSKSPSQRLYR